MTTTLPALDDAQAFRLITTIGLTILHDAPQESPLERDFVAVLVDVFGAPSGPSHQKLDHFDHIEAGAKLPLARRSTA